MAHGGGEQFRPERVDDEQDGQCDGGYLSEQEPVFAHDMMNPFAGID